MPKQHKIGWLNIPGYIPETWNPIVGCTKISEGCDHCYAERMANRLASIAVKDDSTPLNLDGIGAYGEVINPYGEWNGKTQLIPSALDKPLKWVKPRAVFVCSMGDLFHDTVLFSHIDDVMQVIFTNPQHIFIVLTKRPERMAEYFAYLNTEMKDYGGYEAAKNLWLGVTAENQQRANQRIPVLLKIPAAKRFVSIEPMLGHIYLFESEDDFSYNYLDGSRFCAGMNEPIIDTKLDWVIVGGETGPGARPMHPDWVRSVRDRCINDNVPFFFKGWGTYRPLTTTKLIEKLPWGDYDLITKFGYVRMTKHYLGACIDGIHYEEFPKI